jgi:flagellar basal-body rod protein FlgB
MQAIQASLDGLAARQRISAQNLANSETPGYTAQTVNFEDSLSAALASGDPTRTTISTGVTADPPNINGNNVSVDTETISTIDRLEPTITWAMVDASCKAEDVGHRITLLGGVDVIAITGIADTISPAAILSLGIPIGRIGSNPSTPAVWADLLMERLER